MKKYLPFVIGVIVLSIITTPFLWNEELSLSKKIDSEKFSAWGTMVAALLTAITVYLLYKQNMQLIDDRKKSIQPDLHPKTFNIDSKDHVHEPNAVGYQHMTLKFKDLDKGQEYVSEIFVTLQNIGLGVAKNIRCRWIFDLGSVQDYVVDAYPNLIKMKELFAKEVQVIDFIPVDGSEDFEMNKLYALCYGQQTHPLMFPRKKPWPSLELILDYENVYGDKIEKLFAVGSRSSLLGTKITFTQIKKN